MHPLCEKRACACQKRGTVKGKSLLPYAPLSDPAQMHAHTDELGLSILSLHKADLKQKRLGNPLSFLENRRVQPFLVLLCVDCSHRDAYIWWISHAYTSTLRSLQPTCCQILRAQFEQGQLCFTLLHRINLGFPAFKISFEHIFFGTKTTSMYSQKLIKNPGLPRERHTLWTSAWIKIKGRSLCWSTRPHTH